VRQVRQNLPARGISQRGKSAVQCSRRIFNHMVNYLAESLEGANTFFRYTLKTPGSAVSRRVRQIRIYNCDSIRVGAFITSVRFISM
jgi:hypothetical protein